MAVQLQRDARAAVIGCGAISHEHLTFLAAADSVRLEAVCDLSPALADLARTRYGAGAAFTEVDEMLETVRPDVVHVLTPAWTHVDLVSLALSAGAHVICEKPLALTTPQTRSVLELARSLDRYVVETRNLLFNDGMLEVDRRIAAGRIGAVREVDVSLSLDLTRASLADVGHRLPAGAAHDFLPHLAYLFLHLCQTDCDTFVEVDHVLGRVQNLSGSPGVGVDHVDVLISAGGCRGRVKIASDLGPDSFRIVVRGTAGALEIDVYQPYLRYDGPPFVGKAAPFGHMVEGIKLVAAGARNVKDKLLSHDPYHGVGRMLDAIYVALDRGDPLPVQPEQMLASAQLVDRIAALRQSRAECADDRQPALQSLA